MKAVLQLTDLHIFEDQGKTMLPIDTKQSFRRVLDRALGDDIHWELIVLSGDLADLGEEQSYAWIAAQLADCGVPTIALPGNHDDRGLMAKYFDCSTSLQLGRWRISLLDSCIPPATLGQLGAEQIAHLNSSLSAHPQDPHLVFLHHPPVLLGSTWMDGMGLTNADSLWDCLASNQANHAANITLVAGHAHQNFDAYRDGVRVLVSPSTCTQFVPRTDRFALDARGPGYRQIELYEDGSLRSQVKRI